MEVFNGTQVIYLAVGAGRLALEQMHGLLIADGAAFAEPYPFQPHITLARCLEADRVEEVRAKACAMWSEYPKERFFRAEVFAFVENIAQNEWIDVAEIRLRPDGSSYGA